MAHDLENQNSEAKKGAADAAQEGAAGSAESASKALSEEANSFPSKVESATAASKLGAQTGKEASGGALFEVEPKGVISKELAEELTRNLDKKIVGDLLNHKQHVTKYEGSHDLSTGDRFVSRGGREVLVTPNGDTVTVEKDGKTKVEGDVKSVTTEAKGAQTYTMADGSQITVGPNGIQRVERNGRSVALLEPKKFDFDSRIPDKQLLLDLPDRKFDLKQDNATRQMDKIKPYLNKPQVGKIRK